MKATRELTCCICGDKIMPPHPVTGWAGGNNADPISDGRCCDDCDHRYVIPRRMLDMMRGSR